MATSKGYDRPMNIHNREMHTSLWFVHDQWKKYEEEHQKFRQMVHIGGRYIPNKLFKPEDKVRVWHKLCALTWVAKKRGIWNEATGSPDLALANAPIIQNQVYEPGDKVIKIEDYKNDKIGTTLLKLINENRKEELRAEDANFKVVKPVKEPRPGYMMINPEDRKAWLTYWRHHPEEQK
jgi:hypothetical protein